MTPEERKNRIIKAGVTGIAANLAAAVMKLIVGTLSRSISIVLDGVNNAGDVMSSLVTVVGTKIAGRPADREHPMGHGRAEYVSASIIAAVILYAGITALVEAVKKVFSPVTPDYSVLSFIVVSASVVLKIALGLYFSRRGKALRSEALVNSGRDALLDAAISATVLLSAVIFVSAGVNLEAYLAVAISAVIIRAGVAMLLSTFSKIMGERVEGDVSRAIKNTVVSEEGVIGVCDLILNSYGPDQLVGSVNIEVPGDWSADRIDRVSRRIRDRVFDEHGVTLTAVGVHSLNADGEEDDENRALTAAAVGKIDGVVGIHGFYLDTAEKTVRFDAIVDFGVKDTKKIKEAACAAAAELFPDCRISVGIDRDYTD